MLSQMCVWAFDIRTGSEISRVAGKRTRSCGDGPLRDLAHRPGGKPAILVVSAYNKVSVVDWENGKLVLRWDHAFEPGVGDNDLKGQVQFLPDGAADLDGDGWAEVVCNGIGYGDEKWRTVVLAARDARRARGARR